MVGPLAGLKVLDLSRILSGPFCTALLADLGADVVKIERPPNGDLARNLGPKIGGDAAYFMSVNRGKRSVIADVFEGRKEEGRNREAQCSLANRQNGAVKWSSDLSG